MSNCAAGEEVWKAGFGRIHIHGKGIYSVLAHFQFGRPLYLGKTLNMYRASFVTLSL